MHGKACVLEHDGMLAHDVRGKPSNHPSEQRIKNEKVELWDYLLIGGGFL